MSSCSGSVWELRGASRPAAAFLQPAFPSSVGGCQAITLPPSLSPSLAGWLVVLVAWHGWLDLMRLTLFRVRAIHSGGERVPCSLLFHSEDTMDGRRLDKSPNDFFRARTRRAAFKMRK